MHLKTPSPTLSALLVGLALGTPLGAAPVDPGPFRVVDSDFEGEEKALVWTARVKDSAEPGRDLYVVTKAYGGHVLQKPPMERDQEVLYRAELPLPDGKQAALSLRKQVRPAVEATSQPPLRILFSFHLEVGLRLHIRRDVTVTVKERSGESPDMRSILGGLEGDARRVALALMENDASELDSTRLVQMAVWLQTSERPLGRTVKKLLLRKCRAQVDEKSIDMNLSRNSVGNAVLRLPAGIASRVTLRPDVYIREYTAYSNTVVIKQSPLPAYGVLKLTQPGTTLRQFGRPVEPPGTFEIGPLEVRAQRRLELLAFFPLEPPGEHPRLRVEILFRSGRPIEAYLDRGELPPLPPVPKNLSPKEVVGALVRMVSAAVHPDDGTIQGLGYRQLVDLYAIAFEPVQDRPELLGLLEQALLKDIARRSWTYPKRALSAGVGWTAEDAEIALTYPSLGGELAAKLSSEAEPRSWTVHEKTKPARKEIDTASASPHALAVAALARSSAHRAIVEKQVSLLEQHVRQKRPGTWTLEELVRTGQPLKFAAAKLKGEGGELRRRIVSLLRELRAEALKRFQQSPATLTLSGRVQLAHLLSPVWRPYLETPPRLLVDSMDIEPRDKSTAGRGAAWEEAGLRFRAALQREAQELRPRSLSVEEKTRRIDALAERWFSYLRTSQGKLPDELRTQLEEHQKKARSFVSAPE